MFRSFLRWINTPLVGVQTTGTQAFQQYQGYSPSGINGNGGQGVRRTIRAMQPGTIAVGPTHKLNDPTVTGNNNMNPELQPLSADELTRALTGATQF